MTNITHDLILTPILRLQIAQGATGDGKPMVDLLVELWLGSGHSTLKAEAEERGLSLTDTWHPSKSGALSMNSTLADSLN